MSEANDGAVSSSQIVLLVGLAIGTGLGIWLAPTWGPSAFVFALVVPAALWILPLLFGFATFAVVVGLLIVAGALGIAMFIQLVQLFL